MNLYDAIKNLGFNPESYFMLLKQSGSQAKIDLANELLEKARKRYRTLLAANHPDTGGSTEEFKKINNSFLFIESETHDFIKKMKSIIEESEERASKRVLIITK